MTERATEVAAIIDALGDDPTPDAIYTAVRAYDTRDVAAAAMARPAGGGGGPSSIVTCLLARDAALNIKTNTQEIKWDALYDNNFDYGALETIPTGLGLSFAFDGSSGTITTTEAGTWLFACQINRSADDTWQGMYEIPSWFRPQQLGTNVTSGGVSDVKTDALTIPSGQAFTPRITVSEAATAGTYEASVYLSIVRLG